MPAKKKTVTLEQVFEKLIDHDKQFTKVINKILDVEASIKTEIQRVEKRIDNMLGNLEKLTGDFENLSQEYRMITAALQRIERILGDPAQWPESIRSEIDTLKARVSVVEERMGPVKSN